MQACFAVLCACIGWPGKDPALMLSTLFSDGFDGKDASAAIDSALGAAARSTLVTNAGALCYRLLEGNCLGLCAISLVCSLGPKTKIGRLLTNSGRSSQALPHFSGSSCPNFSMPTFQHHLFMCFSVGLCVEQMCNPLS